MDDLQESNINFVPCIKWVKRGVARANPEKVQLSKEELLEIIKDTKKRFNDANAQENANRGGAVMGESSSTADEFNFDNYDQNDDDTARVLGIASLADLPVGSATTGAFLSESDDSDREDEVIKPSDNLVLVGHVMGDASVLEVHVYNELEESFYVHHDILLNAFPLCLEWLSFEARQPNGNYCAVGSMSPIIEVWDLDIINCPRPAYKLGQIASVKKNREHKGHTDAVLALAWNSSFQHVLASGSVDHTIRLWDLDTREPTTVINAFEEKVQCLDWHKFEGQTLLAGGCDKTARIFDCRAPDQHQTWTLQGEAERLIWNSLEPFMFLAGTSTGYVECFDCRKGKLWSLEAHAKEVTGLDISNQCPGLLVTASTDETVKTWDFSDGNTPKLVNERDFNIGSTQCLELCPDSPFIVAMGGDKKGNPLMVFNMLNIDPVKHTFGSRELVRLMPEDS